jgi:uroporphyrinogen III methyltransferase/synthase
MSEKQGLPGGNEGFLGRKAGKPLAGKRIVVPPSRPEVNLLLDMLRESGAEALEFPRLVAAPPEDHRPIDKAVASLGLFDWIVFSGGRCVRTFAERVGAGGHTAEALRDIRTCALGRGAVLSLRDLGVAMDCIPRVHTPEAICESLGEVHGLRFLLIRFEGASAKLRMLLREKGASVAWATGGRLGVEADTRLAWRAFGRKPDAIALASPMAVQYFAQGLELCGLGPAKALKDIPVAAVGPATAEKARQIGLQPSLVSKGHLVDIAEDQAEASALPL